jgi:hypothetical protein
MLGGRGVLGSALGTCMGMDWEYQVSRRRLDRSIVCSMNEHAITPLILHFALQIIHFQLVYSSNRDLLPCYT